jgi:hypothetical protein
MQRLLALALAFLLAGCVVEEDDGEDSDGDGTSGGTSTTGGGGGFAPQQGTAHGSNSGIDVDVTWRTCDEGFCASATATNRGTQTVQVSSICESSWTDRMAHDGAPVAHREPSYVCQAYGREPFGPGASAEASFTWDGQLHDTGEATPAPEGEYTWTLAFWWDDGAGGPRQEAAADVELRMGET